MIRRKGWTRAGLSTTLLTLSAAVLGTVLTAPAASASTTPPTGTRSLATVLASDGQRFDQRWGDYDIVDASVGAVLAAKPDSAVAVLADGKTPLTAFLPTDYAFRRLAHDLTGRWYHSEAKVLSTLAGALGTDTIESVLLYHVVPGATVTYRAARHSDGVALTTALAGAKVTVDVERCAHPRSVSLVDLDPDARNPVIVQRDINRGNVQIAHGISQVLRPVNL
jgi:uncharacterized surface protein with fasciclin (FAS1) repeats